MEVAALIGSICFAICGVPAAYMAWKEKSCNHSWLYLLLWGVGEVLTAMYAIHKQEWILLLNYGPNILWILMLMYYNQRQSSKSDQL